jgi:ferredoxin
MKVWVDQDLCTGDGLCEELCPSIFTLVDGLSFVRDLNGSVLLVGGDSSMVDVPTQHIDAVLDAADECPGECIFVEA